MNDIGLFVIDNCIQLKVEDGDLAGDEGLETAVMISLFTDQRATREELPAGHESQRGWWGDLFAEIEGDQIGSKLWLASRGKINNATLAQLITFANEALRWMIDDGVASDISVDGEYEDGVAVLSIEIQRPRGEDEKFALNWSAQELVRA